MSVSALKHQALPAPMRTRAKGLPRAMSSSGAEARGPGRGAVRRRLARAVRDRRVELPAGADRRGHPARCADVERRCRLARSRRADPGARRGDESGRASVATSRSSSTCRSTCNRIVGDESGAAVRARGAGHRARSTSARGRGAHAHVRPRSRDARRMHARRNDRQQLLRRALDHVAARPSTTSRSWTC